MTGYLRRAWYGLITLGLAVACQSAPTGVPELTPGPGLGELYRSEYSGLREATTQVVSEPAAWTSLWATLHTAQQPESAPPAVDFSQQDVLAVALGERRSGGYVIHIDSVATTADTRTLFVSTYAPGPGCVTTQALSQPVHVVAAPRHAGPTTVATQAHTLTCS